MLVKGATYGDPPTLDSLQSSSLRPLYLRSFSVAVVSYGSISFAIMNWYKKYNIAKNKTKAMQFAMELMLCGSNILAANVFHGVSLKEVYLICNIAVCFDISSYAQVAKFKIVFAVQAFADGSCR